MDIPFDSRPQGQLPRTVAPSLHMPKPNVLSSLGMKWNPEMVVWPELQAPDMKRAIWRAKKVLPDLVFDITSLEGNTFTFPEVQTLLEGITVGGRKVSEADQVLNQKASLQKLFTLCANNNFKFEKDVACGLQALAARGEALEEGVFRNDQVSIAGTEFRVPPAEKLDEIFEDSKRVLKSLSNPFERATAAFLAHARAQFFWDGNKRTGRLMMNGILLTEGQDIITVPAKSQLEFNEKMVRFYDSGNGTEMMSFLSRLQIRSRFES